MLLNQSQRTGGFGVVMDGLMVPATEETQLAFVVEVGAASARDMMTIGRDLDAARPLANHPRRPLLRLQSLNGLAPGLSVELQPLGPHRRLAALRNWLLRSLQWRPANYGGAFHGVIFVRRSCGLRTTGIVQ